MLVDYNPFSLVDKTILITGSSSGIGETIAVECSKMGANVIVTGRNKERLCNTFGNLQQSGCHKMMPADLSNAEKLDTLVEQSPILDGIVLCAGLVKTVPIKYISDEAINEIFEINILSSIRLIKKLLKAKKIAKDSSIVFISSVSTSHIKMGNSLYSATKGAVNSFMKAMALEGAKQRIRSNSIQPGFIPTQIMSKGVVSEDQLQEYISKYPLGVGKTTDISNLCIYLLSDASRWMTGSVLTIDGGLTLQ